MRNINKKAVNALRVIPFLLIIAFSVSLTACKPKEPITADAFKEKLEAQEYSIIDISEQYSEFAHILNASLTEKNSLHIEFFEINNNDNATAMFNGNKATVESYKGNGSAESSVSTGNYQKYTLTTSDTRYTLVRVGATLIYAYCDKAESESLENIIKELGY